VDAAIRYTRSGDVNIAFQVTGEGPPDLVYIPGGFHHIELSWEINPVAQFLHRLATVSRLIRFDKRGTGMSDRMAELPTLEMRMDDVRAVMDAAGSDRAVVFGSADGGFLSVLFAATYPERTSALVLFNSRPRQARSPDTPWLRTRAELEQRLEDVQSRWGDLDAMPATVKDAIPSASEDDLRQWVRVARLSHSPGAAIAYMRANLDVDVRDVLPLIRVPTLVMYRSDLKTVPVRPSARYLAEHIPGARLVELPGSDLPAPWGDQERLFSRLESFLRDVLEGKVGQPAADRVLATVLFTDIVDATARAAELGDRSWRELLQNHHDAIRRQLGHFRGREVDTAGDGFFATFDGPARAIRCACAIRDSLYELGLEMRAGLHTGECERVGEKVSGIAVHIGARVAAIARPGEVLVSHTVKDLVAGSGIELDDRGEYELKGVPGHWQLFRVKALEP